MDHPASLRRDLIERLSFAARTMLRAKWRTVAMFRAPWPLPLCRHLLPSQYWLGLQLADGMTFELNDEQRVVRLDAPPTYDVPPDLEDLFGRNGAY